MSTEPCSSHCTRAQLAVYPQGWTVAPSGLEITPYLKPVLYHHGQMPCVPQMILGCSAPLSTVSLA